jgi:hypothetical protein
VAVMSKNTLLNDKQTKLLIETIGKNEWCLADPDVRLDVWSNFQQAPGLLKNYLCKDGSGYIRGFYNGQGTFYVMRFHLRDEEWTDPKSSPF